MTTSHAGLVHGRELCSPPGKYGATVPTTRRSACPKSKVSTLLEDRTRTLTDLFRPRATQPYAGVTPSAARCHVP